MLYCPLNVEICSTSIAINVNKHTLKGVDKAIFRVGVHDEIRAYQNGKYLGPCELAEAIFKFHIHDRYPPVQRLKLHLPGQRRVFFRHNRSGQISSQSQHTTLTSFMELCARAPFARTVTYSDVVQYFYFENDLWHRRRAGTPAQGWNGVFSKNNIDRLHMEPPDTGELYYLRLLLASVPGSTSFQALKTVNGTVFDTFRAGAQARGLLQSDLYAWDTLCEAEQSLLLFCEVRYPLELWNR